MYKLAGKATGFSQTWKIYIISHLYLEQLLNYWTPSPAGYGFHLPVLIYARSWLSFNYFCFSPSGLLVKQSVSPLCNYTIPTGIDVAYIYITVYKIIILKSQYFYFLHACCSPVSLDTFCSAFQKCKMKMKKRTFLRIFLRRCFIFWREEKNILFIDYTMSDVYQCITLF